MLLRIDPRLPRVWRSPSALQLGVDPPRVVLEPLTTSEERVVHALRIGLPPAAFPAAAEAAGLEQEGAGRLLDAVAPALEREPAPETRRVAVRGRSPLARALAAALTAPVDHGAEDAAGDAVEASAPQLVVLVADWVLPPAEAGAWLRREVPHLPVVVADGAVRVGPVIRAGSGPCAHCLELARRDADPAWPMIAGQLLDRAGAGLPPWAVPAVVGIVGELVHGEAGHQAEELRLDLADRRLSRRRPDAHPECRCGARRGSGWADVAVLAAPRPTTSARAISELA